MKYQCVNLYVYKYSSEKEYYILEIVQEYHNHEFYGVELVESDISRIIQLATTHNKEPHFYFPNINRAYSTLIAQYKTPATFAALFRDDHPEMFI